MNKVDYSEFYIKSKSGQSEHLEKKVIYPNEITYVEKKQKNRSGRSKTIAILAIIFCFCTTLLLSDYFSGGYLLADFDQNASLVTDGTTYYAVQTGMYSDLKTAQEHAKSIKSRGGAGYVHYDGVYRVVASIYSTALQARTVGEKMGLSGIDATIFSFSIYPTVDNSLSANDRAELSSLSTYCDYSYQTLYTLSNELDTNGNTSTVSNTLKNLLSYLENSSQKAESIQFSTPAVTLSANLKGAIEIIKSVPQTPTSSDLRYAYCNILLSRV